MITPELKDKVLNNLLSHNDVTYTFNIIQLANKLKDVYKRQHIYLSRFRSIHLSGILDVKAYRNPASPRLLNTQITIFKTTV